MEIKPFLKWVGGKRKLIPQLEAKFPDYIKSNEFTYVEPFLGGGAMFFHLVANYKLKKAYLNDLIYQMKMEQYLLTSYQYIVLNAKLNLIHLKKLFLMLDLDQEGKVLEYGNHIVWTAGERI